MGWVEESLRLLEVRGMVNERFVLRSGRTAVSRLLSKFSRCRSVRFGNFIGFCRRPVEQHQRLASWCLRRVLVIGLGFVLACISGATHFELLSVWFRLGARAPPTLKPVLIQRTP